MLPVFWVFSQSAVSMISAILGFRAKRGLHVVYSLSFQAKRDPHAACDLILGQSVIPMLPVT
jgi:hypothetical protein